MTWIEGLILIGSGIAVGFVNTLAGGGSAISLSVLMMMGLSPAMANGTNRIAIIMQNIAATSSFKKQKVLDSKKSLLLSIPAIMGSFFGAWLAVDIQKDIFEKAIGIILLVMLFFMFYKPKSWVKENTELVNKPLTWKQYVLFFFIGVYGGFIQVGVGYFLLAALVWGAGYELVKANAAKVLIVGMYMVFSLVVYIYHDLINYAMGFTLAIGTVTGALLASKLAVKKGAGYIRWFILVIIIFTSLHLFGVIDLSFVK
ncbi:MULTISPECIES: sulfite exporter TauE/SafE family protein [unclassified Lentimicrobium]|uniref:sulfite exporter TauE/SafE family protein n=1 Tax=unclassified Lentimicrobium TaxID=2677434 RepID=UPI0015559F8F|nr:MULTISPECIES: sulfite exporter TauE/SafE family protein [unclassified Lentimicrobium]NPD46150.1 sulfite exporter TauE/SafE family protein [Lentimicrobium sp. S6]NPD86292.1 sulfite exporter TauE/SafE family protein [Lentimicrobium sp. L6]